MGDIGAVLVVGGTYAAVIGVLLWLAARVRRSGVGGAVMGPFEEIWYPSAHRSRFEIQNAEARGVSMLSPDDGPDGPIGRRANGRRTPRPAVLRQHS